jgi:uncharacterized membrane protein
VLEQKGKASPALMVQPNSLLRSGGPDSFVSWEGLGQKGQEFVASEAEEKYGVSAAEPVRVYAGLHNEEDLEERVRVIMREFERTRAFERTHIVLFTPSGTGWVNPVAVQAAERFTKGDIASVSIQYADNAAVVQYLIDRNIPGKASSLLFSRIRERLDNIPANERPKLYIYGESLGSLGSQKIFEGAPASEIMNQTDGVLWVGSPSASVLWKSLARERESNRIVFLHNSTDPVVWFDIETAYKRPVWLRDPRNSEISEHMRWHPLFTLGHVSFELFSAGNTPSGIGHKYDDQIPCAVANMLNIHSTDSIEC